MQLGEAANLGPQLACRERAFVYCLPCAGYCAEPSMCLIAFHLHTSPVRCHYPPGFLWAQMVKNLCVMQETRIQSLGQEDPLEKGMAFHSSILAWRIPWTEEPGRLQSMGLQRVGHN